MREAPGRGEIDTNRFFGWRYKKFYETGNVELAWRKFSCDEKFFVRKIFANVFRMTRWENLQMQFLGKQLGILGIWRHTVPP